MKKIGKTKPIQSQDAENYTRSKMKSGFQIVAGAYSSYVTRAIWEGIRFRCHFGMGIIEILQQGMRAQDLPLFKSLLEQGAHYTPDAENLSYRFQRVVEKFQASYPHLI